MTKIETIKFPGRKGQVRITHHTEYVVDVSDSVSHRYGSVFSLCGGWAVRFGTTPGTADPRGVFPVATPYAAWELAVAGMKGQPVR